MANKLSAYWAAKRKKEQKRRDRERMPSLRSIVAKEDKARAAKEAASKKTAQRSTSRRSSSQPTHKYNWMGQMVSQAEFFRLQNEAKQRIAGNLQRQQVQEDLDSANAANEARYQDILNQQREIEQEFAQRDPNAAFAEATALADKNYNTGMGFLNNAGVQEASDIRQSGFNRQQKFASDAISRGVNVPGLMTSMQRGIDRDTTANLGRMNDRLNTQRLAAHQTFSGRQQNLATEQARNKGQSYQDLIKLKQRRLGLMERKRDSGPNVGAIAQYNAR